MNHNLSYIEVNVLNILSLQESCLKVIIRNFSVFTTAFEETEDEHLKMNLRFLQKLYSKTLLQRLIKEKELKECHLNFLLNEYVQDLPIDRLLEHTSEYCLLNKLLPIGQNITLLSVIERFKHRKWNDYDDGRTLSKKHREAISCLLVVEKVIPYAASIHEIHVPFICTDNLLNRISTSCPQLTVLDVSGSRVSGNGLKALYTSYTGTIKIKCNLKCIDLEYLCDIDDDVAALLENVPSLENIIYDGLPHVLFNTFQQLRDGNNSIPKENKYNLTKLVFSHYFGSDISLFRSYLKASSEMCPYVKDLKVSTHNLQQIELCYLFQNIEYVTILNDPDNSISLNQFLSARGLNLKYLRGVHLCLSISILIEKCPKLESLDLSIKQCDPIERKISKKLTNLNSLILSNCSFSDDNCFDSVWLLLNSSPNLETLEFCACNLLKSDNEKKLLTFSTNSKLKQIDITYSSVSFEFVQYLLFNCSSLTNLKLGCYNLNADDFCKLKQIATSLNKNFYRF